METRPVRFEFSCEKAPEKLKFTHNLPKSLITSQAAQGSPEYVQSFIVAIKPVLGEHYNVCRAASSSKCTNCDSPSTIVLQTPMSWLHNIEDPFINVWVNAVCGKGECETRVRQEIQDMMMVVSQGHGATQATRAAASEDRGQPLEVLPCKVCGKLDQTLKCSKCKTVAYCGKEHQRQDWKLHKQVCVPKPS